MHALAGPITNELGLRPNALLQTFCRVLGVSLGLRLQDEVRRQHLQEGMSLVITRRLGASSCQACRRVYLPENNLGLSALNKSTC